MTRDISAVYWRSIRIFYAKGRTWRDAEKNLHAVNTLQRIAPSRTIEKSSDWH